MTAVTSQGAQLELLAERLAELPKGVPTGPIYSQMEKIEVQRTANGSRLLELEAENDNLGDRVVHLETYREFSNGLTSLTESTIHHDQMTCRKILRKLIRRIEVFEWGFRVHYFVGDRHFADLPQEGSETTTEKTFLEGGSNKLTIGVGDGN